MSDKNKAAGFKWQVGIWDKMSNIYVDEIDTRFVPVISELLSRANLKPGETVLDLGTGTGQAAFAASQQVGSSGKVIGVDISPDMLNKARAGAKSRQLSNVEFAECSAEKIPVADNSQDIVLSSLCMMFVIDRANSAREIARVLQPGGRFIAAVWGGPDKADIVKFQQIAGSFAPKPPVEGVGPGALGDPSSFLKQLEEAGLRAKSEMVVTGFEFPNFRSAWDTLTSVTTADLDPAVQEEAMAAAKKAMWPDENKPRQFQNGTNYISAFKP